MPVIVAIKPYKGKEPAGFVKFDDDVEAWTPELPLVEPLVGKELPPDWTLRDSPKGSGKQLLPPKKGGGPQAAWRNTKEGFEAEQEMWANKQAIEEERKDRRTALMSVVDGMNSGMSVRDVLDEADRFYGWLRNAGADSRQTSASDGGGGTIADPIPPQSQPDSGSKAYGEGAAPSAERSEGGADPTNGVEGSVSPKDCLHEFTSPLRPDGSDMPINKVRCLACGTAVPA